MIKLSSLSVDAKDNTVSLIISIVVLIVYTVMISVFKMKKRGY
jgi:hypothetical protein